jgi:hypothetical protein
LHTISVRVDDVTYSKLALKAREKGVSLYAYVREVLREHAGLVSSQESGEAGTGAVVELQSKLSELSSKVSSLEERLSLIEKHMEDLLSSKAGGSAPQALTESKPSTLASEKAPKLVTASELLEAKEPEKGEAKRAREGVFKEITVKWIVEKAKKDPDQFVEEWVKKGYNANRVGDKVVIASDDVVEYVVNELNARGVKGPGALQDIDDKDLKRKAVAVSAAGFIYFDALTRTWKRT